MNIGEAIGRGAQILRDQEVIEPRRESELLLMLAVSKDKTFLVAHPDTELSKDELTRFEEYIDRRAAHEPFQYIKGSQEFFGLDFRVTPDVLIPRPETEGLVEAAITILDKIAAPSFLEVGVGSGCISISILKSIAGAISVGVDISGPALGVAKLNARWHLVEDRLDLRISNVFENVCPHAFNLIVSNPPYVPPDDIPTLQSEVRDFEPVTALTDGVDGLSIVRRLIDGAPQFLVPAGSLLIEIGFNQSPLVKDMFDPKIWHAPEFFPDLQGIPRIVCAAIR